MSLATLTDAQLQVLENILSGLLGVGSSIGIQWLSKRRTKLEAIDEHTETLIKASGDSIKAAQEVVAILKEMLNDQKEYFENKLKEDILEVQQDCDKKIASVDSDYSFRLQSLMEDNESLHIRITKLTDENLSLSIKITSLTEDRQKLEIKMSDLKTRLSKYEHEIITGKHKAIVTETE